MRIRSPTADKSAKCKKGSTTGNRTHDPVTTDRERFHWAVVKAGTDTKRARYEVNNANLTGQYSFRDPFRKFGLHICKQHFNFFHVAYEGHFLEFHGKWKAFLGKTTNMQAYVSCITR